MNRPDAMKHGRAAVSWFEAGHDAGVAAEHARCAAEVERLRLLLIPFANEIEFVDGLTDDEWYAEAARVSDVRAAAAALEDEIPTAHQFYDGPPHYDPGMAEAVRRQAEHWRLNEHPPPGHIDWDDERETNDE